MADSRFEYAGVIAEVVRKCRNQKLNGRCIFKELTNTKPNSIWFYEGAYYNSIFVLYNLEAYLVTISTDGKYVNIRYLREVRTEVWN